VSLVLGLIIAGIIAILVYSDASERDMDAGLWALFVFLILIIGLPIYLIKRSDYPKKGSLQYQTAYQRREEAIKKRKEDWGNKLFYNRGSEDSKKHVDLSIEEINDLIKKIENSDPIVLDILSKEFINNEYYREGYIKGLEGLRINKYVSKMKIKKSTI